MQADLPFFEAPEDALRAAVQALGGAKRVGPMLWPDKSVDNASRSLLDAINPQRAEKLDLTQVIFVMRAARDVGCYSPFQWLAHEVGFDARPVTAAEEVDRLTNVLEQASKTLSDTMQRLERVQRARAA